MSLDWLHEKVARCTRKLYHAANCGDRRPFYPLTIKVRNGSTENNRREKYLKTVHFSPITFVTIYMQLTPYIVL